MEIPPDETRRPPVPPVAGRQSTRPTRYDVSYRKYTSARTILKAPGAQACGGEDFHTRFQDDRPTRELVRLALRGYESDGDWIQDSKEDRARRALVLRGRREDLDAALAMRQAEAAAERSLTAFILGEFGQPATDCYEARVQALLDMLDAETDETVLSAVCCAVHHVASDRALGPLLAHAKHPQAEVRYWVAWALRSSMAHDDAVNALIRLLEDEDEDVRDAAGCQFAMQRDVDSPRIRAALRARVRDVNDLVREEVLLALARRKDDGIAEILEGRQDAALKILTIDDDFHCGVIAGELRGERVGTEALRAAEECAHPCLLEPMEKLQTRWKTLPRDYYSSLLDDALEAVKSKIGARHARNSLPETS